MRISDWSSDVCSSDLLFTCSDSDIVISAYLPHHWRALLECFGLVELGEDERFATGPARARNRAELYAVLAAVFSTRPAAAWLAELTARGILAAPAPDHAGVVATPLPAASPETPRVGTEG